MPETVTFIVGNGLGMAIDPERFSLKNAMEKALNGNGDTLEGYFKAAFPTLPEVGSLDCQKRNSLYTDEAHLRDLQRLLWAHDKGVIDLGNDRQVIAEYFTQVVWQFFEPKFRFVGGRRLLYGVNGNSELACRFMGAFCTFISNRKAWNTYPTHVATLNYDRLLYFGLIYPGVIGNSGSLTDGFSKNKEGEIVFQATIAKKSMLGWFLHLHGSPLFYHNKDNPEIIIKNGTPQEEKEIRKNAFDPNKTRHFVLTYPHFKQKKIEESTLLSVYWQKFQDILKQTDKLVLFGYGGNDPHLNNQIREWVNWNKGILYIVEHDFGRFSEGEQKSIRKMYWQAKFMIKDTSKLCYIPKESILEFDFDF